MKKLDSVPLKLVSADGRAPFQRFYQHLPTCPYPLGGVELSDRWAPELVGPLTFGGNGYHLTSLDWVLYWWAVFVEETGCLSSLQLWVVETAGDTVMGPEEMIARTYRLSRKVGDMNDLVSRWIGRKSPDLHAYACGGGNRDESVAFGQYLNSLHHTKRLAA